MTTKANPRLEMRVTGSPASYCVNNSFTLSQGTSDQVAIPCTIMMTPGGGFFLGLVRSTLLNVLRTSLYELRNKSDLQHSLITSCCISRKCFAYHKCYRIIALRAIISPLPRPLMFCLEVRQHCLLFHNSTQIGICASLNLRSGRIVSACDFSENVKAFF